MFAAFLLPSEAVLSSYRVPAMCIETYLHADCPRNILLLQYLENGSFLGLADNGVSGCSPVVSVPRKLMWISWLIQPGQSLTSRPEQNSVRRAVTNCVKPEGWRIVGHNESEGMQLRNRTKSHGAKVSTSLKPALLHALFGECASDVPESQTMAGNSTVHIGTWESHVVPRRSFQQAEEARRKYGDMAVGPGHSRGVDGVMPIASREPGTLEGPGSKTQRDE